MRNASIAAFLATACLTTAASAQWSWSVNSSLSTSATAGPNNDSDTNGSTSFGHSVTCASSTNYAPFPPVMAGASSNGASSITGTQSAFTAFVQALASADAMGSSSSASSTTQMALTLTTTEAIIVTLSFTGYEPFDGGASFGVSGPSGINPSGSTSTLNLGPGVYVFQLNTQAATTDSGQYSPYATITANFSVVPAPGALALLGLAGMARRRRR